MYKKVWLIAIAAMMVVSSVGAVNKTNAASLWSVSGSGPQALISGGDGAFTVSVATPQPGSMNDIVDIEIYDIAGNRAFQQFFTGQNFPDSGAKTYSVDWTPAASGSYVLKTGVFSANWSSLLSWSDNLETVSVAAPKFSETASVSPAAPTVKNAVTVGISAISGSGSISNAIADLEIYDASGSRVYQKFWTGQNFTGGSTEQYSTSWIPSVAGSYKVKFGIFAHDWSNALYWADDAADITLAAAGSSSSSGSGSSSGSKIPVLGVLNPSAPKAGSQEAIDLKVTNNAAALSNGIVDLEIYNSSDSRVYQQFWMGQDISLGNAADYSASWTPSVSGNYTVKLGLFTANWSSLVSWNNSAYPITVAAADMTGGGGTGTGAGTGTQNPPAPTSTPTSTIGQAPLSQFYVDLDSQAAGEAAALASSDPSNARLLNVIASEPQGMWFGNWNADVEQDVSNYVGAAQSAGKTPVLVAYNIPERDCGGFSAGGANNPSGYEAWINSFAGGIGNRKALVILEPDALAEMDCLSPADQATRENLLSYAVNKLKSLGNTAVYIDAGNANWIPASSMAPRLEAAGIANANGFSLNVSSFYTTAETEQFGSAISSLVGGKHYVIDTSRNGNGSNGGEWCNPSGMALGAFPTTDTGDSSVDAFLWAKRPGESDGSCNGGPAAGVFWTQYAVGLAKNAGY